MGRHHMTGARVTEYVHAALVAKMAERDHTTLAWIEAERLAVAVAANEWAEAHGIARRVTVEDIERVEPMATGHVDYASKLALYVGDLVLGMVPRA